MSSLEEQWQLPLTPVSCEVCHCHFLVSAESQPLTCPHCFRGDLTPISDDIPLPPTPSPELVVPFAITNQQISNSIQRFADSYYLEPRDLTAHNLLSRAKHVYLPMWLVDTDIEASWHAEVGYPYTVTTQNDRYTDGSWQTYDKQEARTRWEPRAGTISHHYANTRAPALDEHDELIEPLGKLAIWDTELYETDHVGDCLIRIPNRHQNDAWSEVVPTLMQLTEHTCQIAAEGREIRSFKWQPQFANQHWTQMLGSLS